MQRDKTIQDVLDEGSGEVSLKGWIYRIRDTKNIVFIVLRDTTNILQCVVKKDNVDDETFEKASDQQIEASIKVKGELEADERAPTGYELKVSDLEVVGESHNFPIQDDQSKELLLDKRHLWLRSRKMNAVLKIRSTVFEAIHEYFRDNDFYEFHAPIFQSTQSEGGSEIFSVDYFDDEVFLAQTWQLPAEAGIFSLEKIYTIAPSFRAENSKTSRHLTEYWHAEMEQAWANFDDIIEHGERLLKHIVTKVLENNTDELEILERDPDKLKPTIENEFEQITYTEAIDIIKEDMDVEWGEDLGIEEERHLTNNYNTPLIVTNYPKEVKAFYMKINPDNPKTVFGCDFLAPEGYGEIIGGSQREEDIEEIKERLEEDGEDPEEYQYYLDTRRYGSVPHGGFGMGVERVIRWITDQHDIKDTIPFPRTPRRHYP